jgi:hypothetical protein
MRCRDYERKTILPRETESGLIQQYEVDRDCFRSIPLRAKIWEGAFTCSEVCGR